MRSRATASFNCTLIRVWAGRGGVSRAHAGRDGGCRGSYEKRRRGRHAVGSAADDGGGSVGGFGVGGMRGGGRLGRGDGDGDCDWSRACGTRELERTGRDGSRWSTPLSSLGLWGWSGRSQLGVYARADSQPHPCRHAPPARKRKWSDSCSRPWAATTRKVKLLIRRTSMLRRPSLRGGARQESICPSPSARSEGAPGSEIASTAQDRVVAAVPPATPTIQLSTRARRPSWALRPSMWRLPCLGPPALHPCRSLVEDAVPARDLVRWRSTAGIVWTRAPGFDSTPCSRSFASTQTQGRSA